jgi:hypothetical protein
MIPIEVAHSLRGERLESIRAGRPVVTLMDGGPIVVVHCIPVRRDPFAINLDVGSIDSSALVPLGRREASRYIFDFDGVLSTAPGHAGKVYGYAELCRNGVIEAVDTALVRPQSDYGGSARFFPGTLLVGAITVGTLRFLQLQAALGVRPPIAFGLSWLRVARLYVGLDDRYRDVDVRAFLQEDLVLPEVIIRNPSEDPIVLLKTTVDQLWNAIGVSSCRDFNDMRFLTAATEAFRKGHVANPNSHPLLLLPPKTGPSSTQECERSG